jgi:hypothetical protein
MSDPNRHSFTLAITPPPSDSGDADASTASATTLDSTAEDTPESTGEPLYLTLSVEAPEQDIIRISAVDGQGRNYEGRLSLSLINGTDMCYVCDEDGCRWVSPCP